jgi:signal transduction histidine kinase/ActR/RegA family two-component response regulator
MTAALVYGIGLALRVVALAIAVRIVLRYKSWRYTIIALGVGWIVAQPAVQYFFGGPSTTIAEVSGPWIFLLTSGLALFIVFQLSKVLDSNASHEQNIVDKANQTARRQTILVNLAKRPHQKLTASLGDIVRVSAEELAIERVGIWLYNEDKTAIQSLTTYDRGSLSDEQQQLLQSDYPGYFAALDDKSMIIAADAWTNEATRELTDGYLKPLNIRSLLDVPIWIDGQLAGIICHEQIAKERDWSKEDQEFAHSLADLCALLIIAERRIKIEQELRDSQSILEAAQDAGQFGSFRWVLARSEITCSGQIMENLGFSLGTQPDDSTNALNVLVAKDADKLVEVLTNAYQTHEPFRTRVRTKVEHGSKHIEVRARYSGTDAEGHFEGTVHDITEQTLIERENKRLEGQLIQSQKMESIGTMAGGIAHDFNNILTPILGYTDVVLADLKDDDPLRAPLNEILNGSLRAKDLVEQILLFSRRFDETREAVDLEEIIHSALRLLRPTLPASVDIKVEVIGHCKPVDADPTQLVQVVVNLCTNAWHAMRPKGGTLTISLESVSQNDEYMTCLTVQDTGVGISENAQKRIFEPFYTTKEVGEGTGLGLSMVHGIVTKLGGRIDLSSQLGHGTQFKVCLPVTDQSIFKPNEENLTPIQRSASILVVDDDKAVAGILKSMLTDLGYETEVHTDSQAALAEFRHHPKQYDMLVTDLTMPNMSGVELCQKIRQIEPDLPLLVLSGYPEQTIMEQLAGFEHCQVIAKPLVRADLAAALTKELQSC